MLDVAHAYRRYQFLGEEFLTWLWYVIDRRYDLLEALDSDITGLEIGHRMVLQNRKPNEGVETLTIKGENADLKEAVMAVKKGAMVAEVHLIYRTGEMEWQFTLKGESLNISNLKTPDNAPVDSDDAIEGAVIDKVYLYSRVTQLVEKLFQQFMRIRIGDGWNKNEVPDIRKWLQSAS